MTKAIITTPVAQSSRSRTGCHCLISAGGYRAGPSVNNQARTPRRARQSSRFPPWLSTDCSLYLNFVRRSANSERPWR